MSLRELRQRRAAAVAEMRSLLDVANAATRDLDETERKRFDTLKADNDNLEKRIADEEHVAEAERRMTGQRIVDHGDDRFDIETRSANTLLEACAAQLPNSGVDPGRAREISQECARRSGRKPQGLFVPLSIFRRPASGEEQRALTTDMSPGAGSGGFLVPTDRGPFIDMLRARLVVRRLGATVLSGLLGDLILPRYKTGATVGWVSEDEALTPADEEFDGVSLSPHHAGAISEYSRNMILQSSPDVEQLFRMDMAAQIATAIDGAALDGGGTKEPIGICAYGGTMPTVAIGAAGGPPTWEKVLDLIASVDNSNALGGSLGFATNSKAIRKMRSTLRTTADTASTFLMEAPNALAGYPVESTSLVPSDLTKGGTPDCSALIFGDWSQLIIGYWSELDILVNPYSAGPFSKGNVQVRAMATCDVAFRHPEAFARTLDMTT